MPNYAQASLLAPMRGIEAGGLVGYSFGASGSVAIAASPGGVSRAAGGTVSLTTSVAHNFALGETVTLINVTSVLGTRFGGNYIISAIGSATTATLLPVDDILLHQGPDTGGGGNAISVQFEQPAVPQAGRAFALPVGDYRSVFSLFVNGLFSGAPGAFEVDVQVSDVDTDTRYQTISGGNITTADATNNTFHLDGTWTGAKFARLRMLSRTNAVGFIGTIGVP